MIDYNYVNILSRLRRSVASPPVRERDNRRESLKHHLKWRLQSNASVDGHQKTAALASHRKLMRLCLPHAKKDLSKSKRLRLSLRTSKLPHQARRLLSSVNGGVHQRTKTQTHPRNQLHFLPDGVILLLSQMENTRLPVVAVVRQRGEDRPNLQSSKFRPRKPTLKCQSKEDVGVQESIRFRRWLLAGLSFPR